MEIHSTGFSLWTAEKQTERKRHYKARRQTKHWNINVRHQYAQYGGCRTSRLSVKKQKLCFRKHINWTSLKNTIVLSLRSKSYLKYVSDMKSWQFWRFQTFPSQVVTQNIYFDELFLPYGAVKPWCTINLCHNFFFFLIFGCFVLLHKLHKITPQMWILKFL